MPIVIRNGKQYRMSLLTGSVREEKPPPYTRSASADRYQTFVRSSSRREPTIAAVRTFPWKLEEDRMLRELKKSKISWERISVVMDDRPVAELKKRWVDIQNVKQARRAGYRMEDVEDNLYPEEKPSRGERHVSFSSSTEEEEDSNDDEYIPSRPTRVKRVYYMDDQFTLDEVLLLHQIAADWEKDRWETISNRFNNKTGRTITPDQARTVVID